MKRKKIDGRVFLVIGTIDAWILIVIKGIFEAGDSRWASSERIREKLGRNMNLAIQQIVG